MNELPTLPIVLACLVAALLLVVEHYALLPLCRLVFRIEMPPLVRYVLGVLALNGTLVVLFDKLPTLTPLTAVIATIAVTVCGGSALGLVYAVDWVAERLAQWRESQELQA